MTTNGNGNALDRERISICTCTARMCWVQNDRTGKPAPIDPIPVPDGPITIITRTEDGRQVVTYHVLTKAEREAGVPAETPRYTNHFQTCPRATAFKGQSRNNTRVPGKPGNQRSVR